MGPDSLPTDRRGAHNNFFNDFFLFQNSNFSLTYIIGHTTTVKG